MYLCHVIQSTMTFRTLVPFVSVIRLSQRYPVASNLFLDAYLLEDEMSVSTRSMTQDR
jgi:hypothetical protein